MVRASERALANGALHSIPTEYEFVEDGGMRFFVRILTNLALKDEERKKQKEQGKSAVRPDPFLPYEQDLFVAHVSETHVAILNKYNVVEHHLLIVTREFESQEMLLTLRDFEALWLCLWEYNGLCFYNGGEAAGASQAHKHLQMVPLPLAPEGPPVPIEPLLGAAESVAGLGTVPGFHFLHVFVRLDSDILSSPQHTPQRTFAIYRQMLREAGMLTSADAVIQTGPYCLLVTREWMLLVPRSREFFEGISLNSLAFAGALLVRREEQLEILRRRGPMAALRSVAFPSIPA